MEHINGTTPRNGALDKRVERICSLVDVGVDLRSALATELIRALRDRDLDPQSTARLLSRLSQADPRAPELAEAKAYFEAGGHGEAIGRLQAYLQRRMVDEVPIGERRLRRSGLAE